MEVECPCCHNKFEPSFEEGANETGVRVKTCICPNCHMTVSFNELSDYEQMKIQGEEMKKNMQDYEDGNIQDEEE